jgi:hypothetical protein
MIQFQLTFGVWISLACCAREEAFWACEIRLFGITEKESKAKLLVNIFNNKTIELAIKYSKINLFYLSLYIFRAFVVQFNLFTSNQVQAFQFARQWITFLRLRICLRVLCMSFNWLRAQIWHAILVARFELNSG